MHRPPRPPRTRAARLKATALTLTVGLVVGSAGGSAVVAARPAGAHRPPHPARGPSAAPATLRFEPCADGFECARLAVPVDHRAPDGEQVAMAVIRAPARKAAKRLGALVVNYGGPGDAGTVTLRSALETLPGAVRDRFDVVSFDPRGTGGTRGLDCIDDATADALVAEDPTPDDAAELERFYAGRHSAVDVDGACVARYGAWLAAIGTRNVARDLDLLRRALGEAQLSFLGYSYGTVLGAVYAQEFPDGVRAMVLDGAVDLSASRAEEQAANARGFEQALDAFLAWCATAARCALSGATSPREALTRLRDRFEAGLTLPVRDGRTAGAGIFYLALVAALYDREAGWPALALALRAAEQGDGTIVALLADAYLGRDPAGRYSTLHEAIGPIRCADAPRPTVTFAEYRAAFDALVADAPFFGPLVGGGAPGCDPRLPAPRAEDVLGDVRADAGVPVLVIGTTGDPATPYRGAKDLVARIADARLLTFESTEHAAFGRGVRCIDRTVTRYLVRGTLPPEGRRCGA